MMNITSQFYENNDYGVKFRYFVDTQDIWWYNYDDICKYLELCSSVASRIYKYNIEDEDKIICFDDNNDYTLKKEKEFINSKAIRYLIKRNNERNIRLVKVINNIEFVGNSHELYNDADELKARIELLNESLKIDDYEEIVYQSYEIANSKSGRDILDKAGIIDKNKEELLDLIREDIYAYDDYIDEVEMTLITRKEDMNDTFKQYEYCRESTCPSWLIKCVK